MAFLEKLIFFVFVATGTDPKRKDMFAPVMLISIFEALLLIPLGFFMLNLAEIDAVHLYLNLPIYLRYFIVGSIFFCLYIINAKAYLNKEYVDRLFVKFHTKQEKYFKMRWALVLASMLIVMAGLAVLRILKNIG